MNEGVGWWKGEEVELVMYLSVHVCLTKTGNDEQYV